VNLTIKLAIMSLIVLALPLAGARSIAHNQQIPEWASIELESSFSALERDNIAEAFNLHATFNLDLSKLSDSSHYTAIFPDEPDSIGRFLDERINYISRLDADEGSRIIAVNMSSVLWFKQLRGDLDPISFNGRILTVDSSRFGRIELGMDFHDGTSKVFRLSTLIHEARHSDCPGGVNAADLQTIRTQPSDELFSLGRKIMNKRCGFPHTTCSESRGFVLRGLVACEDQPWGPFALESIYAATIAKACTNCDESTLQEAQLMAIDAASRVEDFVSLMDGSRGLPDMSSMGLR
jgi:hypothetical protein